MYRRLPAGKGRVDPKGVVEAQMPARRRRYDFFSRPVSPWCIKRLNSSRAWLLATRRPRDAFKMSLHSSFVNRNVPPLTEDHCITRLCPQKRGIMQILWELDHERRCAEDLQFDRGQ